MVPMAYVSLLKSGMWKRKVEVEAAEAVNFLWKRSALMKKIGSRSENVEKEMEAEAIFSKSSASEFSNWLKPLG